LDDEDTRGGLIDQDNDSGNEEAARFSMDKDEKLAELGAAPVQAMIEGENTGADVSATAMEQHAPDMDFDDNDLRMFRIPR
jgi:hypothetical protein